MSETASGHGLFSAAAMTAFESPNEELFGLLNNLPPDDRSRVFRLDSKLQLELLSKGNDTPGLPWMTERTSYTGETS